MPSWDSSAADELWTEACGKDRWLGTTDTLEQNIRRVSDARLWQLRMAASESLVEYARKRLARQLTASGAPVQAVDGAKHLFDPNALTLGFARRFADWQQALQQQWATLRFGELRAETKGEQHVFEVQVCLRGLNPNKVRVELYADGVNGDPPFRQEMTRGPQLAAALNGYAYRASVPARRPASDYTARVIPHCSGVAVPLESAAILWQR